MPGTGAPGRKRIFTGARQSMGVVGPVVQPGRTLRSHRRGREFKSHPAHHFYATSVSYLRFRHDSHMGYTMYDRILVAVDGSDTSLLALSHAVKLAKVFGSELTLLSVIDKFKLPFSAEYGLGAQESHERLVRGVIENLNEVTEELRKSHPDIRIDPRVEEGRPAQIIVEVAEDFDLIVMGSQGFGFIAGWFLGSVSNEVVNSCTKPLLIVKKPADPEPGLSP